MSEDFREPKKTKGPLENIVVSIAIFILVLFVVVFLPARLAGENRTPKEARHGMYKVNFEGARSQLPDEWVWRARPVSLDHMYRKKRD